MRHGLVVASAWILAGGMALGADAPAPTIWQSKLTEIQMLVRRTFPERLAGALYSVAVMQTADLSGNQEALVSLGSGGYTDDVTVMQLQGQTPVFAKFNRGGKVEPTIFISGASNEHGGEVRLVAKDHAVFVASWDIKSGRLKDCHTEVYQWNDKEKDFSHSRKLTKLMGKDFCDELKAKMN